MKYVDLHELMTRESERVEWKENVADVSELLKTITAFANDFNNLGGGYVVCGVREKVDPGGFPEIEMVGLDSERFKHIENKVLTDLRIKVNPPIIPLVEEEQLNNNKRILVFIIPATGYAHTYKATSDDATKYYIRVSRETREARNGLLRELLTQKGDLQPWDKRPCNDANIEDIDLLSFRDKMQTLGLWNPQIGIDDYFSPKYQLVPFIPSLTQKEKLSERLVPKNFTVLLFSRDPLRFFQNAYTIVSYYPGLDRSESLSEKKIIDGTIVEQAKKIIELLKSESYYIINKDDSSPNQMKYPFRAIQEAVINAIVHRDYEIEEPLRITIFLDRIEINSPGTLLRSIDQSVFKSGKAFPYWRNQTFAYFFSKYQLAQAEGQGIPTMIRLMREEGCPPPIFEVMERNVICILSANSRYKLMLNYR